jgi:hypothetical protein
VVLRNHNDMSFSAGETSTDPRPQGAAFPKSWHGREVAVVLNLEKGGAMKWTAKDRAKWARFKANGSYHWNDGWNIIKF